MRRPDRDRESAERDRSDLSLQAANRISNGLCNVEDIEGKRKVLSPHRAGTWMAANAEALVGQSGCSVEANAYTEGGGQ